MRFCDWLTIDSLHPYFKSKKMECLGIFPSEKTQLWLKNHRHNWKFTENSLKLSFSISSINLTIEVLSSSKEFFLADMDLYPYETSRYVSGAFAFNALSEDNSVVNPWTIVSTSNVSISLSNPKAERICCNFTSFSTKSCKSRFKESDLR